MMYWRIEFKEGGESFVCRIPKATRRGNKAALIEAKSMLETGWAHIREGIPFSVTMELIEGEMPEEVRDE